MTMISIADKFEGKYEIIAADKDTTVTIADLAVFTSFERDDASKFSTSEACIAFDALKEEYEGREMVGGDADFYDGFYMEFADGSTLRVRT